MGEQRVITVVVLGLAWVLAACGSEASEPAGWVPLTACVEQATHPEGLYTPEWDDCGDACRVIVTPDEAFLRVRRQAWHDGTRGWLLLAREGGDRTLYFVAPVDGPAVAAWRSPPLGAEPFCGVYPWAIGEGRVAFVVQQVGDRTLMLASAGLDSASDDLATIAAMEIPYVENLAVDASTIAAGGFGPDGPEHVAILADRRFVQVSSDDGYASIAAPTLIDGRAYWTDEADEPRLMRASLGEEPAQYVLGRAVIDAEWVAWQVDTPSGREMWAAPFTEDPAELAPRKIADLPRPVRAAMGGGRVAFLEDALRHANSVMHVFDLADGRHRVFRFPPERWASDFLYVAANEVMLAGSHEEWGWVVYRVDLDALPYEE